MPYDINKLNNILSNKIIQSNSLKEMLASLGCDVRWDRSDQYIGPCPVHDGEDDNLKLWTDGEVVSIHWICYSAHCEETYKPSLIGFVRGVLSQKAGRKVELKEAVRYLRDFTRGVRLHKTQRPPRLITRPAPKLLSLNRAKVRSKLSIPSRYFVDRGFDAEVLDRFDVGDSEKLGRAVVPLYDDQGTTCIGYAARSLKPPCESCKKHHQACAICSFGEPKWRVSKGFPTSSYLYNYSAARACDDPIVFLVEGADDVLRLAEAGYVGVALLGSEISEAQLDKLRSLAQLDKEIWVAFDNDEGGKLAKARYCDALFAKPDERFKCNIFTPPQQYKDIGETPAHELRREIQEHVDFWAEMESFRGTMQEFIELYNSN